MINNKNYYAIIDIGSNTMRLVIYLKEKSMRLREVENVKAVVRLRNYLGERNQLTDEGIEKLIETLNSFKEVVQTYDITEFACVATATIRQAKNKKEIMKLVSEEIGWEMDILTEIEEAYYGYLSVVNSTKIEEGITVDIGGGSTEVTYFKNRILKKSHSFPFGALNLMSFFKNGKPTNEEINQLKAFLSEQFSSLGWLESKSVPLIGIGGSARNLAQIHQNNINYPLAGLHQYFMDQKDIKNVCHLITSLHPNELEKVDGLSKDRADTIIPASFVFLTLYEIINSNGFILSRKGLRDGVFYEYLAEDSNKNLYPNVLEDSMLELVYEYNLSFTQIEHILHLAKRFLNVFIEEDKWNIKKEDWIDLERGCYVYNLGKYVDSESSSQHTFYILANRTIDGLMHQDRLKMALIASYKNKNNFTQYITPHSRWISEEEENRLRFLGSLLKFVYSLDATRRQIIQDLEIKIKDNVIYIVLVCNQDYKPEQFQAEKQKKHLEKELKHSIELKFTH